jgi:antitoxin component HigA of HigAB toxin-antitoxin module
MAVTPPKVLVPEKVSPDGLALLQKTLDVHEKKGLSAEQLEEIIGELQLARVCRVLTSQRRL